MLILLHFDNDFKKQIYICSNSATGRSFMCGLMLRVDISLLVNATLMIERSGGRILRMWTV